MVLLGGLLKLNKEMLTLRHPLVWISTCIQNHKWFEKKKNGGSVLSRYDITIGPENSSNRETETSTFKSVVTIE